MNGLLAVHGDLCDHQHAIKPHLDLSTSISCSFAYQFPIIYASSKLASITEAVAGSPRPTTLMTQLFGSSSSSATHHNDKKAPSSPSNSRFGSSSHFPTKLKNFFRINTNNGESSSSSSSSGLHPFRQSRFLRGRSTSSASQLEHDNLSPTANANPYFAHQGPPALRHHNDTSRPPSPPDTPKGIPDILSPGTTTGERTSTAGKDELARKLRRVASAPNAQGMFTTDKQGENRPVTADKDDMSYAAFASPGSTMSSDAKPSSSNLLPVPTAKNPQHENVKNAGAFRRTYSSNSIKVRNVEVGPGSFDKIKLLGKGDVGKVYLVREKKSNRLYAMKGWRNSALILAIY